MEPAEGLTPGDHIRCGACGRDILICVETCPPGSYMKSSSFTHMDGSPLEHQARMQCPFCLSDYMTIMTSQKVTVPKGRGF